MDAIAEAEKIGIARNRAVTYENDSEGVATNYRVVGEALASSYDRDCCDEEDDLFDDDWADEIEEYRDSRKAGK